MKIGFEYEYIPFSDIIKSIKLISDFNLIDFMMLFNLLTFTTLLIFYIVPFINMIIDNRKKQNKAHERKKFIKQIIMQKEIESEIEKEIKDYNFQK